MTGTPTLSVVVLAYNEEANLEAAVKELVGVLEGLDATWELVIVDDGSRDSTGALADRLARTIPGVRTIHHPANLGLGEAYRTGFGAARGSYLSFFPADRQFPASILADFLPRMAAADLVLGYLPEQRRSAVARGLSAAERLLYRALFGALPPFQGILMVRRALLDEIELTSVGRGWAVVMELVIRAHRGGYALVSVPTPLRPRSTGRSKVINWRTIWANLAQVVALRLRL